VRSDFAERILIVPEETAPVVRGVYTAYKTPENHWSVRQLRGRFLNRSVSRHPLAMCIFTTCFKPNTSPRGLGSAWKSNV
jgi:hypothetical protein